MSETAESTAGDGRYLIVRSGAARFAIPAAAVAGVHHDLAVYPVPGGRAPLLGLSQQAGEPLVVVDLLELVDGDVGGHHIIVMLKRQAANGLETVGLAVDEAERIVTLTEVNPAEAAGTGVRAVASIDGQPVRIVDPDRLPGTAPESTTPGDQRDQRE
jgi:chemotaxis signal transduction protein